MRPKSHSPNGRLFRLQPRATWSDDIQNLIHLPKRVTKNMVIVVGYCPNKKGWVKVATVSSFIDPAIDPGHFIPIRPAPKDKNTQMQLKICGDGYGYWGVPYKVYVRVDSLHEVPLEILGPQLESKTGVALELQVRSFGALVHYLKRREVS